MNGGHHRRIAIAAGELLRWPREMTNRLALGAAAPDHAVDVFVHLPNGERVTEVLGREVTALQHFLPGFCWQDDPSLSVLEEIGSLGAKVTRMTVSGNSIPMIRACRAQPGATLCELRFPSAADQCGHHAAVADGNPFLIGYASHFEMDCLVPQHTRGMLLGGHQPWEDEAEGHWRQHVDLLMLDRGQILATLGAAVAAEVFHSTSVEELCEENAEWSRRWFANRDITTCARNEAIAVSVRAVAATMHGIKLITASGS